MKTAISQEWSPTTTIVHQDILRRTPLEKKTKNNIRLEVPT